MARLINWCTGGVGWCECAHGSLAALINGPFPVKSMHIYIRDARLLQFVSWPSGRSPRLASWLQQQRQRNHSHHTHMLSPLPTRCFILVGRANKFFALVASRRCLFLLALIKRALVKHASDCLRRGWMYVFCHGVLWKTTGSPQQQQQRWFG